MAPDTMNGTSSQNPMADRSGRDPDRASRAGTRSLILAVGLATALAACATVRDEAEQIVRQRQHVASVETMTALLDQGQAAESRATSVALGAQVTATAVALGVQKTATAASVQTAETATAVSVDMAVRATQMPIIAAATVAAAEEAARIRATAIVEAGHRAEMLVAQGTATAQANAARAQADAETERAGYVAWLQRRDAAAHYVVSCGSAMSIASRTTSVPNAVATARANQAYTPVGSCSDTQGLAPPPRTPSAAPSASAVAATSSGDDAIQSMIARVNREGFEVHQVTVAPPGPESLRVLIGVAAGSADGYTQ
jgi:hypothetical protein